MFYDYFSVGVIIYGMCAAKFKLRWLRELKIKEGAIGLLNLQVSQRLRATLWRWQFTVLRLPVLVSCVKSLQLDFSANPITKKQRQGQGAIPGLVFFWS